MRVTKPQAIAVDWLTPVRSKHRAYALLTEHAIGNDLELRDFLTWPEKIWTSYLDLIFQKATTQWRSYEIF